MSNAAAWLAENPEDHVGDAADLNQYWYSCNTVETLLQCVRGRALHSAHTDLDIAFVSTPSLFFALNATERSMSRVLDFDASLGKDCDEFIQYDFRHPLTLPEDMRGKFGCCVIDPPYVTEEVWRQYAQTAKYLLPEGGGLVLCK